MNDLLGSLGLCKRAGALRTGEDTVRSEVRSGRGKLILLSHDAGDGAVKRARTLAHETGIPLWRLPEGKNALGAALGLTMVSIAAVTDAGFAGMLLKKLKDAGSGAEEVLGKED